MPEFELPSIFVANPIAIDYSGGIPFGKFEYEAHSVPCELSLSVGGYYTNAYNYTLNFIQDGVKHSFTYSIPHSVAILLASEQLAERTRLYFEERYNTSNIATHDDVKKVFAGRLNKLFDSLGYGIYNSVNSIGFSAPSSYDVASASKRLPGVEAVVGYPCECYVEQTYKTNTLWYIIQHLNDKHEEWTRERIADWMDRLHDAGKVDLEFKADVDEPKPVFSPEQIKKLSANIKMTANKFDEFKKELTNATNSLNEINSKWKDLGYTTEEGIENEDKD